VVAVGRVEAQGRAVLEAAKVAPQVLALAARREVAERSAVAAALAEMAAGQVAACRITQFRPRSDLQFFKRRPSINSLICFALLISEALLFGCVVLKHVFEGGELALR
jgi:hypothetical protein